MMRGIAAVGVGVPAGLKSRPAIVASGTAWEIANPWQPTAYGIRIRVLRGLSGSLIENLSNQRRYFFQDHFDPKADKNI